MASKTIFNISEEKTAKLAVLIDADNAAAKDIKNILDEVIYGDMGKVMTKEGFNVPTVIMLNKSKESIKDHYVEDGFSNYIRKQNLEEDFDKVIKKYI